MRTNSLIGCFAGTVAIMVAGCASTIDLGTDESGGGLEPGSMGGAPSEVTGGASSTISGGAAAIGGNPGTIEMFTPSLPHTRVLGTVGAPQIVCAPADTSPTTSCRCWRPGANSCVQGDNVFTTALITPEGGTIALVDTLAVMAAGIPVQLDFPPGAVAQPTLVTIAETVCPDPSGHELYSPVYEILPRDLVLSQAVKIQLPITGSHPNNTLGGGQFGIYVDTGTGYTRLGNSYLNAGFFQGSLNHLGSVFVGYDKSDPFCAAAGGATN